LAFVVAFAVGAQAFFGARSESAPGRQFDGFNVIAAPGHPFGSESARLALTNAKELGASTVAIVPFLWQSSPTNPDLVRGADMSDEDLRSAIRDAHALGLAVLVKPHIWVPQSWAGTVAMNSEEAWKAWFTNYQRELDRNRADYRGGTGGGAGDRHRTRRNHAANGVERTN
jgi:hypothetical protein